MLPPDQEVASTSVVQGPDAKLPQATVTRIKADVDLQPPAGCSASVLLRLVGRDDTLRTRTYACWLSVGRFEARSFTAHFKYDGGDILRVDLPVGTWLDVEYLQAALRAFLHGEPTLPPDTVIVTK
jgi:hypothetical protein